MFNHKAEAFKIYNGLTVMYMHHDDYSIGLLLAVREVGFSLIDEEIEKYSSPIFASRVIEGYMNWQQVKVEFNNFFKHLNLPK